MKALIATACVVVILIGGSIIGKYVYDSFDVSGEKARQFELAKESLGADAERDQYQAHLRGAADSIDEVTACREQGKSIPDAKLRADLDDMEWLFPKLNTYLSSQELANTQKETELDIAWAERRLKIKP